MKDNEPIEGEIVEDTQPIPPDGVVVASNGAWRDAETGRFVPGGPVTQTSITVENTAEFRQHREQKQMLGFLASHRRLDKLAGGNGSDLAWEEVVENLYIIATDKKARIASVQAARELGNVTGFAPGGKDGGSGPAPGRASVTVDLDQDALMEFITSRRAGNSPANGAQLEPEPGQPSGGDQLREAAGQTDGDTEEKEE